MSASRSLSSRERVIELGVGIFFFAALFILGTYTIILKRDLLSGHVYSRVAEFSDVAAIQVGDRVLLRGLQVGRISHMDVAAGGSRIQVRLALTRPLTFYKNYLVEIRSPSVLGGRFIYLELGTTEAGEYPADAVLEGRSPVDAFAEAGNMIKNINEAATEVKAFAQKLNTAEGTLGKLVNDRGLYDEAQKAFTTLGDAGKKVQDAATAVAGIREDVTKALGDVKGVTEKLAGAGDSVKAAGDSVKAAADNANQAITEARSGKGTIGKLLSDDQLYTDLRTASQNLSNASTRIADKESSLGKLMGDDGALYKSVKESFDNMSETMKTAREITDKVKRGEGSLGKLVNDESLYEDARKTVKEVRGAVQDFREQAPITTFGSLVFGAL